MTNVSLVGAGPLAIAIGMRLHAMGMRVACWNRTPAKLASLQQAGARLAATWPELLSHCPTLFVCVSDAAAMRSIFLQDGVTRRVGTQVRIVNLGTVGDEQSQALERDFADVGFDYTDMPVSGGVEGALAGTLAAYVGRAPRNDAVFSAVLAGLANAPVYLENNQMAQAMKVLNNLCEAINLWGAAEAVAIGEKYGFSLPELHSGLTVGRGNSIYLGVLLGRLARQDEQVAVSLATRQKDIQLALKLAASVDAASPLLEKVSRLYTNAIDAYGAQRDQTACHILLSANQPENHARPAAAIDALAQI